MGATEEDGCCADKSALKNRVLEELQNTELQCALAELVAEYWCEFYEVFTVATVEESGKRPENIANEMFSCLHHVVRGLAAPEAEAEQEIRKAKTSHIKRATLDSYKIAINSFLESDSVLSEVLDYVLVSDHIRGPEFEDVVREARLLGKIRSDAKTAYVTAKTLEGRGDFDGCIQSYNQALNLAADLRDRLHTLEADPMVVAAVAKEGLRRSEREKDREEAKRQKWLDRRVTVLVALTGSVLASLVTSLVTPYAKSLFP